MVNALLSVAFAASLGYHNSVPTNYSTLLGPPNASLAPAGKYARIIRTRGRAFDYELTREDVGWAAKMAAFEGDPAEVLWTMTQRFALTYPGQRWPSFTYFIRKFSQPINPDWYRGGKHCTRGGRGEGTLFCGEEKLGKRDRVRVMTWDELVAERPEAVAITLQWAQGLLPNPVPRAVNFAVPTRVRAYMDRKPDTQVVAKKGNWFFSEMGSGQWHANTIIMRQPEAGMVARAEPETTSPAMRIFWRTLVDPVGTWGKRLV
jgi:hypothetical protein